MKLHEANPVGSNVFTASGSAYVEVNKERHEGSLIVAAQSLAAWRPSCFEDLTAEDFQQLLALKPEVILLGTGKRLRFPHPRLYAALTNAGIGVDVMDTAAACRTYNFLLAEGRGVIAALMQD